MKATTFTIVLVTLAMSLVLEQRAAAADKLIELIPEKAFAAVYIQRPQRALQPKLIKPLLEAITDDKARIDSLLEAVKRIPGPVLIGAITPAPKSRDDPEIFIATEAVGPQVDFDELVEKTFLPVLADILEMPDGRGLVLEKGKTGRRILDRPGGKTLFTYAVKDRIALGSTVPQLSLRWARGEWPQRRWVGMPGVRRLLRRLPKTSSVRVFVNPVSLLKHIEKQRSNSPEELALEILAPQDALAGAIDLAWERSSLTVRATVALAEECEGLAKILTRPPSSARLLGVFPDDFTALGRIGWGGPAGLVAGAYALSDTFDETISAEYREELAEFRQETGVAWDTGILGNLVGEMAFGVRVDFTRQPPIGWAVVCSLADPTQFRRQLDTLISHFKLTFREEDQDGLPVQTATKTLPFSMAVARGPLTPPPRSGVKGGLLIVADNARTVADVAKQAGQGKRTEPAGPNLRACYAALGDPNLAAVMLDIGLLREKVPILPLAVGPKFAPMLAEGSVGFVLTVEENVATADFRWSLKSHGRRDRMSPQPGAAEIDGSDVMVTLTTAFAKSIAAARRQAKRVVSAANMRSVGQALYIYAQKHGGAFPESLEALVRAMPDRLSLKTLTSPYDGRGPESIDEVNRAAYLVYRPGLTVNSDPREVILAEREVHDEAGANFLFVDSHVEFIREPQATHLLKLLAEGADEIRVTR